ncbi:MAG: ABC transporter permease subunit [Anaerosomatales bacterium]|nr:ABC transporter permease subunit [Anaerosomatales bacterium]
MRSVLTVAKAVFFDSIRRRILLAVLVFAGVMVALIPSLPDYGLGVEKAVFGEIALAVTFIASLVVTLGLSVTRVPSEVERRTVYAVLARPVARWQYLVGTWLGTFAMVGVLVGAFAAVDVAVGAAVYGTWLWKLMIGALGIWLEMGVVAAFGITVSTVVSPVTAIVAEAAFLFVGHSKATLVGEEGALALKAFYPSLDAFNVVAPVTHGNGVPPLYLASMVVVFVGFVGVLLVIGAALFGGRDL